MEKENMERTSFNFDEEVYPRAYRPSSLSKSMWVIAFLIGLGVFYGIAHVLNGNLTMLAVPGFGFVLFTVFFLDGITEKTILYKDRIIRQSLFKKIEMKRDDIAGIKLVSLGRGVTGRLLVNKNRSFNERLFFLPDNIEEDAIWRLWMRIAPDLDAQAIQNVANDTAHNAELGTSVDERTQSINRAISITTWLPYLVAVPFLMVLRNSPYALYAALIMQVVALVAVYCYGSVSLKSIRDPSSGSRMILIMNSATLIFWAWTKTH